jgi:hypothetical protein
MEPPSTRVQLAPIVAPPGSIPPAGQAPCPCRRFRRPGGEPAPQPTPCPR